MGIDDLLGKLLSVWACGVWHVRVLGVLEGLSTCIYIVGIGVVESLCAGA